MLICFSRGLTPLIKCVCVSQTHTLPFPDLPQVRQLRATQRLPCRNQSFNGRYSIPTFAEYLDVALQAGRPVGVYPGDCAVCCILRLASCVVPRKLRRTDFVENAVCPPIASPGGTHPE